jgi:hypothetical protein
MEVLRTLVDNFNDYSRTEMMDKIVTYMRKYYGERDRVHIDFGYPSRFTWSCRVWFDHPIHGWVEKGLRLWKY